MRASGEPVSTRRRGRPPVAFERIIATAVELLDTEGIAGLSMRSLADRLGSGTATLYRHVDGKDELLALVVDQVLGELTAVVPELDASWQDAVRLGATGLFATLTRHPGVVTLLVSHAPVGPNGMRVREQGLAVLLAAGFAPQLAARAYTVVAHYVVGFAIQQSVDAADSYDAGELRSLYQRLDPKIFPATRATARHVPGTSIKAEFDFGLDLILDGLTQLLAHRQVSSTGPAHPRGRGSR